MQGKQFTDLTKASDLKDTNIIAVHDGNGLKKSSMEDVTIYMADKFSNPNLLINPDFKINQRGQTEYTDDGYTVDRWKTLSGKVSVSNNGLTIQSTSSDGSWITQKFEKTLEGFFTLSIKVSSINGKMSLSSPNGNLIITSPGVYSITLSNITEFAMFVYTSTLATIEWVKLEKGSIATPFIAPNPTEELLKCKRFTSIVNLDSLMLYGGGVNCYAQNYTNNSMRINPTVKILSKNSNDFIIRGFNGSNVSSINLGEPKSITSISSGKVVQFEVPISYSGLAMTTHDGLSTLLLDAEIY